MSDGTSGLKATHYTHAGGNLRTLTVMGDTLLAAAQDREVLDEQLPIDLGRARRARESTPMKGFPLSDPRPGRHQGAPA